MAAATDPTCGGAREKRNRLTPKQAAFVDAYVGRAKGNATEAARIAGYQGNENTLSSTGWETLRNPAVADAVEQRRAELAKDTLTPERILALWTAIATDPDASNRDRLVALRDAAKALGMFEVDTTWDRPAKAKPNVVIYLPDNGRQLHA